MTAPLGLNMKILRTFHNSIPYRFEFFQSVGMIEVLRNEIWTYTMKLTQKANVLCNCPGARRWHKCWHKDEAWPQILAVAPCMEEWTKWAEDAAKIRYEGG